jgi:hypothetical protein
MSTGGRPPALPTSPRFSLAWTKNRLAYRDAALRSATRTM